MSDIWILLLLALILISSALIEKLSHRITLPPVVGYMLLGILVKIGLQQHLSDQDAIFGIFKVLADLGIACLLFRVGLTCNLEKLLRQLKQASWIWVGDFSISFIAGFSCSFYLLGLGMATSLIVATAFTATSLGVTVAVWEQHKKLDTEAGRLMIDVAEMDDLSGVFVLGMVFAVIPILHDSSAGNLASQVSTKMFLFFLSAVGFGLFCYLFAKHLEHHITAYFKRNSSSAHALILIVGCVLLISALSDLMGMSLAIGAFFTGLMFSRDREAVRINSSFDKIYAFFAPFFFIHIGLSFDYQSTLGALSIGAIFLLFGALSKLIGNGLPVSFIQGKSVGLLLGISMIPRAEIALVVAEKGRSLGVWAVSDQVFGALVVLSIGSCILSPALVSFQLKRTKNLS